MGKHGPCFHCGVTSTPLWRNGPPEKPVLCNACGSRWRTKGTLANYTPHHAQTEFMDMEANKVYKAKSMPSKKETIALKRKNNDVDFEIDDINQYSNNVFEEEGSNRTTSSSAISYTNNYGHSDSACGSELKGRAPSAIRESLVPSRKRTFVGHPTQSSVEKLRKELKSILNQQQQSCNISMSSQEDVLVESGTMMDPFDIGHGGFLLKYTNFNFEEGGEESDASSIIAHKKSQSASDAYSAMSYISVTCSSKQSAISSVRDEKEL